MKRFIIGLGKKVLGFAIAKALEGVPENEVNSFCQDKGVWFTENVTPWISENSEGKCQRILDKAHEHFNIGADHDDQE